MSITSLSGSYSYRLMAAQTICDCFSADKSGPSQDHVCLNQRVHLSSHFLEASLNKIVESRVVIPDFHTWLTLKIADEIVHNPYRVQNTSIGSVCVLK